MLLKDDKKRLATVIIKRIRGGDDYDKMKEHNESYKEAPSNENGDEVDYSMGYDSCCNGMIEAFEQKDPAKLKSSLMNFIEMALNERDDD